MYFFPQIMSNIQAYDRKADFFYKNNRENVVIEWIVLIAISFAEIFINLSFTSTIIVEFYLLCANLFYLLIFLSVFKLNSILHMMYLRFAHMNRVLVMQVSWSGQLFADKKITVYDLRLLHMKLYDCFTTIQEIYSSFLLVLFVNHLLLIIIMPIYFYSEFDLDSSLVVNYILIVLEIVCLCVTCHHLSHEV